MSIENHPQAEGSAIATLLKTKKSANKIVAAVPADIIVDTAHQIENMSKEELVEYAHDVRDERGFNALKLGGALIRLMEINCRGSYSNFWEWVEKELAMRRKDARAKIKMYQKLVESKVTEQQLEGLRWSKIVIIAPALSPENCEQWIAKAKEATHGELRAMVEAHEQASDHMKAKSDLKPYSVKLHADQMETWLSAIDKAKAELDTEYDSVAIDNLAMRYLGGAVQVALPKFDAKQWMQDLGLEGVLNTVDAVFPNVHITVEVRDEADPQEDEHD